MNPFAIAGLVIGLSNVLMAGLVYFTNRHSRVSQLWALFCLAVSLWGFASWLVGVTPDPDVAIVWWRIINGVIILAAAFFYHFAITFTRVRHPRILAVVYVVALTFVALDATPLVVAHVRKVFGEFYYNSPPGPLYIPFTICFLWIATLGHIELWRGLRRSPQITRQVHIGWLLVGTALGFLGGIAGFLPTYGIDIYPYGNFAAPLFPILMTYAFLHYRLIDVNLAIIRGLTFLLIYAFVIVFPFFVGHTYQAVWHSLFGEWWWIAPVAIMGFLASASPVWFLFLVRRIEQRLWQAQRRYHRTLIAASSGMTRIKDLHRLCRLIVYVMNRTVGLVNTGLFLFDPQQERYELVAARYRRMLPADLAVADQDALITVITHERNLLMLDELERTVASHKSPDEWTEKLAAVCTWMRKLEARLIVPSFTTGRLLGFLVLWEKRSQEPYTTDDIAIFSGLANQAALGIENALFFEELKTNEAYMIQSEKLASLGQLASGMAHEIHNPLTIISGEAQLYLERFTGKDEQVDKLLSSIIEECHRAADITRRILRFAKPAPMEFGQVDLGTIIEESMTLVAYQVRLDRIQRHVEYPKDLPKVRGNQNQLQEVLLNLVLNACQAMGQDGGTLEVVVLPAEDHLELRVSDSGPGIPQSKLRKVFDPFYTTKQTGTGLGLFVSQRIVNAHEGTISVQSVEGKGTTFTIRIPIAKETAKATKTMLPPTSPDQSAGRHTPGIKST